MVQSHVLIGIDYYNLIQKKKLKTKGIKIYLYSNLVLISIDPTIDS